VNADSYFAIGKTHLVCQDYTIAETFVSEGDFIEAPIAIVSDGCSSSPHTDFGARVLARAARNRLRQWQVWGGRFDMIECVADASRIISAANLTPKCLDATLLMAYFDEGQTNVIATGDGVIVARRRDSHVIETWDITFNRGAPGYLSYTLDVGRLREYLDFGLGVRTVTHSISGGEDSVEESQLELRQGQVSYFGGFQYERSFDPEIYDLVIVASDGLTSFQRRESTSFEPVDLCLVVPHLTNIKGFRGQFMTRRARRFLNKWCPANGWHHNDDVAVAAIYVPEEDDA